ncbi:MAG: DUF87 domain-containing protein [Patescibacteria group bacterium]|nr:DUF87 domain-containing protein [Patescibacteria group bacterium]
MPDPQDKKLDNIQPPKGSYFDLTNKDAVLQPDKAKDLGAITSGFGVKKEIGSTPLKVETNGHSSLQEKPKETKSSGGFFSFGPKMTKEELEKQKAEERKKSEAIKREEEAKKTYEMGLASIRDLIAPSSVQITPNYLVLNDRFVRTLFIFNYPRFIFPNWLSPLINMDMTLDIGMFIYPKENKGVLDTLRKRSGQVESALNIEAQKGLVRNPELETALQDIEELRERLARGEERLFQLSLYITLQAKDLDELDLATKKVESTLGGSLIYTKRAGFQMDQGFRSTLPLGSDFLDIRRNMNTGSLSTTFPFTSMDLTSNQGIMYGINRHNNGLIIFDRFELENYNSVVFAKAGAGKSYAVKLEILRYMMFGTDIIVIDPENEYKNLCKVVGGSYLSMSLSSDDRINPFDLPPLPDDATLDMGEDNLRSTIITQKGLMNLLLGKLDPEEDSLIEKALLKAYELKGITNDPATQKANFPLMADVYNALSGMPNSNSLMKRMEKYVTGTFSSIFNKPTNIDLDKGFVVFNIRDLETSFRPIAMYMVLDFIWSKIRKELRKRMLIVDEAWLMMEYEDAAKFIYSIAKRARKYYLGLTTITQDVEDFLSSKYGRAIVTNSSLQLLLKQSPASIESVGKTFNLTQGERALLLESGVGEGLFFAGVNHVAIKVIASYTEDQIVTTSPKQIQELEKAQGEV